MDTLTDVQSVPTLVQIKATFSTQTSPNAGMFCTNSPSYQTLRCDGNNAIAQPHARELHAQLSFFFVAKYGLHSSCTFAPTYNESSGQAKLVCCDIPFLPSLTVAVARVCLLHLPRTTTTITTTKGSKLLFCANGNRELKVTPFGMARERYEKNGRSVKQ